MCPIIDQTIDRAISRKLLIKNAEEREAHIPSGKLSAGQLGKPLQWQMLKVIGVPPKELDEYVLRKFQRGHDVEEWIVAQMEGVVEQQKEIEYRGVVGFIDALVDTADYEFKLGIIPYEIKSVSNAKFRNILKDGEADMPHRLQDTLYALSIGSRHYSVTYVASDDYRILSFTYETADTKEQVDKEIDAFNEALAMKEVPIFEAKQSWQNRLEYADYPDWIELTQEQVMTKIKNEYPLAWEKLQNYELGTTNS